MMGLRLVEQCLHCKDELVIYFRKEMNGGRLQCAVVHASYQTQPWVWKDLHGFEDLVPINGPERLSDGYRNP